MQAFDNGDNIVQMQPIALKPQYTVRVIRSARQVGDSREQRYVAQVGPAQRNVDFGSRQSVIKCNKAISVDAVFPETRLQTFHTDTGTLATDLRSDIVGPRRQPLQVCQSMQKRIVRSGCRERYLRVLTARHSTRRGKPVLTNFRDDVIELPSGPRLEHTT